jgi:hypothetical protein
MGPNAYHPCVFWQRPIAAGPHRRCRAQQEANVSYSRRARWSLSALPRSASSRARSAASARYAIDHAVDVMWGWMADDGTYETHSVVEFVAADTGQRWLVEVGSWTDPAEESETAVDAPRAVRATAGQPMAIVSAPVVDLALWAWTRGNAVQISGQPPSLAALEALLAQGMQ